MKTLTLSLVLLCCCSYASAQGVYKSSGGSEEISVTWKNNRDYSVYLVWYDFQGKPSDEVGQEIKAGKEFTGTTFNGHLFIVKFGHDPRVRIIPDSASYLIPAGKSTRRIEITSTVPDNVILDNKFAYSDNFQTGSYQATYSFGTGLLWVQSWKFKSNGSEGKNLLTEISRTRTTIELQDPKDMTKVILRRMDNGGAMAETTRAGKATTFNPGTLSQVKPSA